MDENKKKSNSKFASNLVCIINDGNIEDNDFKSISPPFIIGNIISENEKDIDLEFEYNQKGFRKKIKRQNAKKLYLDSKELNSPELHKIKEINPLDCLINITNRIASKRYFNFVDEGILLLYENFPQKEIINFRYTISNDKTSFNNEDKNIMVSSIMKSYDLINYDELYIKLIDKQLRKRDNVSFFFLSNEMKDGLEPSRNCENIKYLIKTMSVYNKLNFPLTYLDDKNDETNGFLLLDKVYQALQLLELFGSSSCSIKEKQMMSVQPNFLYNLKIYYNRKHLVPRCAKIKILAFNKYFLDLLNKNLNLRSYQVFYALLRGGETAILEELDLKTKNKPEDYKILNKTESIPWEIKEDLNNYRTLSNVFKTFHFSKEDVSYVFRTLALILHISNLEFEKNSNNEVTRVKNIKSVEKVLNIQVNDKVSEKLEQSFLFKIKVNLQQKQIASAMKMEEALLNLNRIIQDLYEKLFTFVTMKVNKLLFNELVVSKQSIIDQTFKEISIIDVSNNSNFFSSSNVFNLLHFYVSEKSFQLIEENMVDSIINIYERANFKNTRVNYHYSACFENILSFFEHPINGLINLVNEFCKDSGKLKESDVLSKLESNKSVIITNNKNNYNVMFKHVDGDYNFSLNGVLEGNIVDINYNLINIIDIMINNLNIASEDLLKVYLQENKLNTFFNIGINNFSTFLDENAGYKDIFICSISQENFESSLDKLMQSTKSLIPLNLIRKMRIESYIENVLNKYSRVLDYKDFYIKYEALYDYKSNDKPKISLKEDDPKFAEHTKILLKGLNIEEGEVFYGDKRLLFTHNVNNLLESKLDEMFKYSGNAAQKLFTVLKMIKLKKYVKNLKAATVKIQKTFKKKLVEIKKKYTTWNELKIFFWILSKFKRLRFKKMKRNVIKLQKNVRYFLRMKAAFSKTQKLNYENWSLDEYIKIEEKIVKPKYEYGKFNIKSYVKRVINSAVEKSSKIIVSEHIKESDYENLMKKNLGNFNAKNYLSNLCKVVVNKIDYEKKLDSHFNDDSIMFKQTKIVEKQTVSNTTTTTTVIKISDKKEETKQVVKKPSVKQEPVKNIMNSNSNKTLQNNNKKSQGKFQDIDKKKSDNLNIIREEIKAEDSEKKEPSSEDKILMIQGKWKSNRAFKLINIMREKVFIIQRNFRKVLIRKYDLPDNYFYNEVFLRKQLEIFEKNVMDNMKVLFPNIFEAETENKTSNDFIDEEPLTGRKDISKMKTISRQKLNKNDEINLKTQSKLITEKSLLNLTIKNEMNKNSIIHNPYEDGKIHLFANILDIDFMVETDEVYEKLWASSYHKIFTHCINANAPLQLISLGSSHTLCLSNKGKVYSFGWNNYGQCGIPVKSTIISKKELEESSKEEQKGKSDFSVSKSLKVINKVEGMKIPQIEELMITKSLACGEDHTLLLDHDGEVWCFGINLNGQLGLGHKNLVEKPSKLASLSKLKITSIKTEGEVNFAVSGYGDAYMWPWNDRNKLRYDPLKISLKNEKVTNIACGNNFVMLLCNSGKLYSMGKTNNYGQLGLGDSDPRYRPTLIEFFVVNQERVTQISCGYKHAACKTSTGRVYTWGLGVKGQLGHGDFNNYSLPHQLVFDNNQFIKALQVSCGFRSTFFLLDSRKIYFAGCTSNTFMQNYPIQYNYIQKIPELKNESNYSIVRILTTWTKSFSILYATIADSTTLKLSPIKLNSILTNLASKWDNEYIDPPYIEAIAGYFSCSYMKKSH